MVAGNAGGAAASGYHYATDPALSVEVIRSVNGLESRHYPRFLDALEHATYLDLCDSIPRVRHYLDRTGLPARCRPFRQQRPGHFEYLFEWTWYELGAYLQRHRCLFASAEAALLREMVADPAYRQIAGALLPDTGACWFHQIREDGRRYSENLDLIKEDLLREIEAYDIDTVFLSSRHRREDSLPTSLRKKRACGWWISGAWSGH